MLKGLVMAGAWLLVFSCAAKADRIDDAVVAEMDRQNIPGVSIAVVKDGKIVKEKGYGLANLEHQVPVTVETKFQSGSVGKQFTAALVMLLVEAGKLKLDSPVSAYLPNTPPAWEKVTVRHLLTHTAGLDEDDRKIDLRRDYSDDELLRGIAATPLLSAPGEKWAYSNIGYQVLGILCTKVGGKFYGDQLRERIFEPANMQARIISEQDIVAHRAAGYDRVNGQFKNQQWVSPSLNTTADGSLYLTAHDLANWDIALYGDKILSPSAKELSWTPVRLNGGHSYPYGFGWQLKPHHGHRLLSHNGRWQGFTARISRYIDDKLTIIVLANRASVGMDVFSARIAAIYLPELAPAL